MGGAAARESCGWVETRFCKRPESFNPNIIQGWIQTNATDAKASVKKSASTIFLSASSK